MDENEGVLCNDNFVCVDDFVTLESIDDTNTCIAIDTKKCTTCDSIKKLQILDPISFNSNPIKKIFSEGNFDTEKFWELVKSKCGINKPQSHDA